MSAPFRIRPERRQAQHVPPRRIPVEAQRGLLTHIWELLLTPGEIAESTTATADHCRPLRTGARSTQHEDHTSALQERGAAFDEDDPREHVTTIDSTF